MAGGVAISPENRGGASLSSAAELPNLKLLCHVVTEGSIIIV